MDNIFDSIDIDAYYYQAVDLLKQLIQIPSYSRQENNATDLLEQYIRALQLNYIRKGNNLIIQPVHSDSSLANILLNSHIDTVRPVASWSRDPHEPIIEDGRLFGLGSNDAGASLVSLLYAFIALQHIGQPYNLYLALSAEEEVSGKNGFESIRDVLPPISFAVVGEPTGMNAAIAEKGLMVIDGVVYGKSGHAARNEGINAIYEALPVIERIHKLEFPKVSELLGATRVSMTQINAGTQHNVIPDKCEFVLDVRTNECYSNQEAYELLQQQLGCELRARSFRLNSSSIEQNHPFVQRVAMLGKSLFGSPTLSDQALMPFSSVKIGPGDSARSHTADEYIQLDEIREAIPLYIKLLNQLQI